MSGIIIKDSSNTTLYTFGAGFSIGGYDLGKRTKTSLRAYQHGAKITADKKLNPRLLVISGVLYQTEAGVAINTSAAFEAEWDELMEQTNKETLHIYGYKIDRYMIAECLERSTHKWVAMNHSGTISLSFRIENPFWYSTSQDSNDHTVDETPEVFTETNGGKETVYSLMTFTAGAGSNISKIIITNTTDGALNCTYEPDSNLTSGDDIEIDSENGTMRLNSTNDITNFSGSFLKLLSGVNSFNIVIEGTPGVNILNFTYRDRYL